MARKRPRETNTDREASEASTFNARVMKKLKTAFARDSEVDLLGVFPSEYSARLNQKKKTVAKDGGTS